MATIDYKEKYEQALERAVKLRDDLLKNGTLATAKGVESIFPELVESEDEKVRKRIIALVNAHGQGMYKDEMLAWLEKQGDQKPNYCHHEVDLSGCSEEYCKAYYDGWNNCNQQHAQLEAEQKPAEWSEEDEKMLIGLIDEISGLINHATPFQTSVYAKYLAWPNPSKTEYSHNQNKNGVKMTLT